MYVAQSTTIVKIKKILKMDEKQACLETKFQMCMEMERQDKREGKFQSFTGTWLVALARASPFRLVPSKASHAISSCTSKYRRRASRTLNLVLVRVKLEVS